MIESHNQTSQEDTENNKHPEKMDNPCQKVNSTKQGELQDDITEEKNLLGSNEIREAVFTSGNSQMANLNAGLVLLGCIQTTEVNAQSSQLLKVIMVEQANTSQTVKHYRKIEPKPGSIKTEADEKDELPATEENILPTPVKKAKIVAKAKFVESNPTRRGVKSCPRCQQLIGYRAKQCKFCYPRTIKKRPIKDNMLPVDIRKAVSTDSNQKVTEEEETPLAASVAETSKLASNMYQVAESVVFTDKEDIHIVNEDNIAVTQCRIVEGPVCTVSTITEPQLSSKVVDERVMQSEAEIKNNEQTSSNDVLDVIEDDDDKGSGNTTSKGIVYNEVSLHDLVVTLLKNDNQNKTLVANGQQQESDSNQTKDIELKTSTVIGSDVDGKPIHIINILPENTSQDDEEKKLDSEKVLPMMTTSASPVLVGPMVYHPTALGMRFMYPVPKAKDTQGSLFRRIQPKGGDNEEEDEAEDGEEEDEDMVEGAKELLEDEENDVKDVLKKNKKMRRSSSKGENSRLLETNATRRGLMQCTKCFKKIGCRSKVCKFCKGSLFDNPNSVPSHSPPEFELPASLKGQQNVVQLILSPERHNSVYSIRKYKSGPDNRCFVKCTRKTKDDDAIYICDYAPCSSSIESNDSLGGFSCEHIKSCLGNQTEQAVVVSLQQEAMINFPESLQKELQAIYKESVSVRVPLVQWVSERTFAVLNTTGEDGMDNFVHVRFQKSRPLVFCSGKFCLMNTVQKGGSYCVHYHACLWAIASDYRLRALLPICRIDV